MNDRTQPERISHFEIADRLGAGAMGVVYRARDTLLQREVALKLIRPEMTADRQARSRFLRECQSAASINHPGIATVYEAGEAEDGQLFFASELVDGEMLRDRIRRGRLPPDEVVDLGLQLAEALGAAHERGITHRDIKPGNLMLMADGRLKVLDFGLAIQSEQASERPTVADTSETLTRTNIGLVMGTPAYMSPEQATGMALDARTDVFSSGSVLYEMACGRQAFSADTAQTTLRRVIAEDPRPAESVDSSIPAELGEIIRKALAKEPAERFASGVELAAALRGLQSRMLSGTAPAARQLVRRRRAGWLAGAAAAVLLLAAGIYAWVAMRPSLSFAQRDKLLVADVDNQTDDAAFGPALRIALEADLQQSPFVSIFDKSRLSETLRLMRREPTTPVDEELGRDICRFSGVRALLLPRILAAGEAYELHAILIDPVSGEHVDRIRVTARGREEVLLHAVDELAQLVRKRLGESLASIQEADEPVVQVTTSSWEALQHLAAGEAKWRAGAYKDAAPLYRLALEKDPEFVMARGSLGLLLIQFLGQAEEGKEMLARALRDAGELPERERMLIEAVNRHFVDGDREGALAEYRMISELYPDIMQAYHNSGHILQQLGRYDEAAEMYEKSVEIDPQDPRSLRNLWFLHVQNRKDPTASEAVARRLVAYSGETADFRSMLGWSLAIQGRFEESVAELRAAVEIERHHRYAFPNLAHVLLANGEAAEAVPLYREFLELVHQERLPGHSPTVGNELAIALARAGQSDESRDTAGEARELLRGEIGDPPNVQLLLILAHSEVLAGQPEAAERLVARALELGIDDASTRLDLAQAYALLGRDELAIEQLEQTLQDGYRDPYFPLVMPEFHSLRDDSRFRALFRLDAD